ncbi:MAG: hypothetical protein JW973_17580 [Bacteroidales bacterium]|nr:hypothetical protein [Bacteroidales bacterium]
MQKVIKIWIVMVVASSPCWGMAQDSLQFKGQMSAWALYNPDIALPVYLGGRYIPQLNYSIQLPKQGLIDFEASANINGLFGFHPFDTGNADGKIKSYRLWARYSTQQFELRLGLQKINFGSASMLRPLMWFDKLDPRDPLQLTDGVWGLLIRYYFLNNANIWLWGLYGNEDPKTWEIGKTNQHYPELGGRLQSPVPRGEVALSYHFRMADARDFDSTYAAYGEVPENRMGLDGKWDIGVGLWVEGSWINKGKNIGSYTNQEILNAGIDYTFGIGNGLNMIIEQLVMSYDEKPFAFSNTIAFSGLSMSYPIGLFDNVGVIVFYDWTNNAIYNFVNWQKQFNRISLYFMAFWNPKDYQIPLQEDSGNLFAGKGVQVMVVWNH